MKFFNPCEEIRLTKDYLQHWQPPGAPNFGKSRSTISRGALASPAPFPIPFQDRARGEMRRASDGQ